MPFKKINRLGIFGGTFDPVHHAHLHIAQTAGNQLELESILWIVSGAPSHKNQIASINDRLEMVRLALRSLDDPRMHLDERETVNAKLGLESFTSDTVASLQHELPGCKLILILGEDQIQKLNTWRRWKWLIRNVEFAVFQRPSSGAPSIVDTIRDLGGTVHFLKSKPIAISSSQIRHDIKNGVLDSNLVPRSVADYISIHSLYQ